MLSSAASSLNGVVMMPLQLILLMRPWMQGVKEFENEILKPASFLNNTSKMKETFGSV